MDGILRVRYHFGIANIYGSHIYGVAVAQG